MARCVGGDIDYVSVRLEEGGKLELSRWDEPVPEDRLLPVKHKFARPDFGGVLRRFEAHHAASENHYRGDGSWESKAALAGKPDSHNQMKTTVAPPKKQSTAPRYDMISRESSTGASLFQALRKTSLRWDRAVQRPKTTSTINAPIIWWPKIDPLPGIRLW